MNPKYCICCGQYTEEPIDIGEGSILCPSCADQAVKCPRCGTWIHEDEADGQGLCIICHDDMHG